MADEQGYEWKNSHGWSFQIREKNGEAVFEWQAEAAHCWPLWESPSGTFILEDAFRELLRLAARERETARLHAELVGILDLDAEVVARDGLGPGPLILGAVGKLLAQLDERELLGSESLERTAKLTALIGRQQEMLKRLERWVNPYRKNQGDQPRCPLCLAMPNQAHYDTCELAAPLSSPDAQKAAGEVESLLSTRANFDELARRSAQQEDVIERLRADNEALRQKLTEWEEREAACCPEGVGFPEYIHSLSTTVERLETAREGLRGVVSAKSREAEALRARLEDAGTTIDRLEDGRRRWLRWGNEAQRELVALHARVAELETQKAVAVRAVLDRVKELLAENEAIRVQVAELQSEIERRAQENIEVQDRSIAAGLQMAAAVKAILPVFNGVEALRARVRELEGLLRATEGIAKATAGDACQMDARLSKLDELLASEEPPASLSAAALPKHRSMIYIPPDEEGEGDDQPAEPQEESAPSLEAVRVALQDAMTYASRQSLLGYQNGDRYYRSIWGARLEALESVYLKIFPETLVGLIEGISAPTASDLSEGEGPGFPDDPEPQEERPATVQEIGEFLDDMHAGFERGPVGTAAFAEGVAERRAEECPDPLCLCGHTRNQHAAGGICWNENCWCQGFKERPGEAEPREAGEGGER